MSCRGHQESFVDTRPEVKKTERRPLFTGAIVETLREVPANTPIDLEMLITKVREKMAAFGQVQEPWVYPLIRSEAAKNFGTVAVGNASSLNDQEEPMDVIYKDGSVIPPLTIGIQEKPINLKGEEIKELYNKYKKVFDDLVSGVMTANNVPESIMEAVKKLAKDWEEFSFEENKSVVLCGQTGNGKTTTINALTGADVLPTGSMGRATTLAVTEIMVNKDIDSLYKAEIEYFTPKEFKDELENMRAWIDGDENSDPNQVEAPQQKRKEAEEYFKCIFGCTPNCTVEEMLKHARVNPFLEKGVEKFSHKNVSKFKDSLTSFVCGASPKSYLYHLVKKVRVFLPTTCIPENIVLVDVPGYHDGNYVRKSIADQQFASSHIVWVVTSVHRALDDETTKTLVNNVETGILSRSRTLAVICTQNDEKCEPDNFVRQFQDNDKDPEMKDLQEKIKQSYEQSQDESSEMADDCYDEAKVLCAKWRGQKVKQQFEAQFKKKIDDWDVRVFPISAQDQLKLSRKGGRTAVFKDEKDTGVLELRSELRQVVDRHHCAKLEEYIYAITWLQKRLETKEINTNKEEVVEESQVTRDTKQKIKAAERICRTNTDSAIEAMKNEIEQLFKDGCDEILDCVLFPLMQPHEFWPIFEFVSMDDHVLTRIIKCIEPIFGSGFDKIEHWLTKFLEAFHQPKEANPEAENPLLAPAENAVLHVREMLQKTRGTVLHEVRQTVSNHVLDCNASVKQLFTVSDMPKETVLWPMTSAVAYTISQSLGHLKVYITGILALFADEAVDLLTTQLSWPSGVKPEDKKCLKKIVEEFSNQVSTLRSAAKVNEKDEPVNS